MDSVGVPSHAPQPPPSSRPDSYAHSPFRKFPPELKLEVLSHLKDTPKDADEPTPDVPTPVVMSSVCTDLQILARCSPNMWTTSPLRNLEGFRAAVQYSAGRPLTYHAFPRNVPPSGINAHKAVLNEAWNHMPLLERLYMGPNEDSSAFLERFPAPNLVELNACGVSISAHTFHAETPSRLSVLKLKQSHVASNSPVFASPQLSDIALIQCRSFLSPDAQSELAKIFQRVQPSAKNVAVEDSSLSLVERGDDDADPVPIHLPNVESFRVVDDLRLLAPILASVTVHTNAKLEVVAYLPDGTDSPEAYIEPLQQVHSWFQSHFSVARDAGNTMTSLTVRVAADGGTTFTLSQPAPAPAAFQQAPTGRIGAGAALPEAVTFTARFVWPAGPETAMADEDEEDNATGEVEMVATGAPMIIGGVVVHVAMGPWAGDFSAGSSTLSIPHAFQKEDVNWAGRVLGGTIPFVDDVRKLEVAHSVLHTVDGWITIALYCVRVEEVVVSGPAAYGLITLFGQAGGSEKFPALSVLSVRGVTFARRKTVWGRGVTFGQRLVHCLDMRTPGSVRVSVRECVVEGGSIERLRASPAVLAVEWDGVA